MTVSLADVQRAAAALGSILPVTPCLRSQTLSQITGADVWCKFENHQFTASFKERGALNRLLALTPEERLRGVCAPSAGNHAQGLARHAGRLGIPCTLVMPRATSAVKIEHTRALGAQVVLEGDSFDAARAAAEALTATRGLVMVPPYDDELVIAGQGTVALEMLAACPQLDVLVVPVGGGGLVAGMAVAGQGQKPGLEIVGVQAARFAGVAHALSATETPHAGPTIADGIAIKQPGRFTLPVIRERVSDVLLVQEGHLEEALLLLLEVEKTVVEGAGAAALAALRAFPDRFRGRCVGVVLSGGNIDPLLLAAVIERGMVRAGRLVRVRVEVRDLPGALADVTRLFGQQNANIDEVVHQRAFSHLPVAAAEVDFVLRTRGQEHVAQILSELSRAGYAANVVA